MSLHQAHSCQRTDHAGGGPRPVYTRSVYVLVAWGGSMGKCSRTRRIDYDDAVIQYPNYLGSSEQNIGWLTSLWVKQYCLYIAAPLAIGKFGKSRVRFLKWKLISLMCTPCFVRLFTNFVPPLQESVAQHYDEPLESENWGRNLNKTISNKTIR